MNRLTEKLKDDSGYEPIEHHNCCNVTLYDFNVDDYDLCVDKLGRLEDIEEQLGCPLEVFINIMLGKIKEIVVNYSDAAGYYSLYEELTTAYVSGIIESYEHVGCLCLETNLCDVPIKDYQKNWWLKGEKDE